MKFKPYTYTFNVITHILVYLIIVNTLEQSCTLDMGVKIKCIIIIITWATGVSVFVEHADFATRTSTDVFLEDATILTFSLDRTVRRQPHLLVLITFR